tara:strand:+ start:77 stop:541 length:465 start_codon:yes stop_codon:yes gene_type:complete
MRSLHTEIINANLIQIDQFEICFYNKKDSLSEFVREKSFVLYVKNGFRVFASDECWEHFYDYKNERDQSHELEIKIISDSVLSQFVEHFEMRMLHHDERASNWAMFDLLWDAIKDNDNAYKNERDQLIILDENDGNVDLSNFKNPSFPRIRLDI